MHSRNPRGWFFDSQLQEVDGEITEILPPTRTLPDAQRTLAVAVKPRPEISFEQNHFPRGHRSTTLQHREVDAAGKS